MVSGHLLVILCTSFNKIDTLKGNSEIFEDKQIEQTIIPSSCSLATKQFTWVAKIRQILKICPGVAQRVIILGTDLDTAASGMHDHHYNSFNTLRIT